eukprot:926215-Rhodomonas_salina.1
MIGPSPTGLIKCKGRQALRLRGLSARRHDTMCVSSRRAGVLCARSHRLQVHARALRRGRHSVGTWDGSRAHHGGREGCESPQMDAATGIGGFFPRVVLHWPSVVGCGPRVPRPEPALWRPEAPARVSAHQRAEMQVLRGPR